MTTSDTAAVEQAKQQLRQALKARRQQLPADVRARAGRAAARRVVQNITFSDGNRVALFWPLGSEIDTSPLRLALHHLGAHVLLPRTHARGVPLSFHRWQPTTALVESRFGVMEPPATLPALDPDIVIVPLLGFDGCGRRIGYGAGHYDCTLAAWHRRGHFPRSIGLAFEAQCVDEVPSLAHDMPLDMIITEQRVWRRTA